jgi:hypothetical protein
MGTLRRALAVLTLASTVTACTSTVRLPIADAPQLSGGGPAWGPRPELRTVEGKTFTLPEQFTVTVVPRDPGAPSESFDNPAVVGLQWGRFFVVDHADPRRTYDHPVGDVAEVRVRIYSAGKTAGLVVGLTLGTLTLAGTIFAIIAGQAIGRIR